MFTRALSHLARSVPVKNVPKVVPSCRKISTFEPLSDLAKNDVTKSYQKDYNSVLEGALSQVNTIVADHNGKPPNLHRVISDEVDVVMEILQKLVGTNRSLSQVEQ